MDNALYAYSALPQRPPLVWPDGARVAFYIGLNIEHYEIDRPSTSIFAGTAGLSPDPLNYGWRDYGLRVGLWRIVDLLDRFGLRATAIINSDVVAGYPDVVNAGLDRDWAWVAHGKNNSTLQEGMTEERERAYLVEVLSTIEAGTGRRPKGWMGPALTETYNTPRLLGELGLDYVLDWCADDQPFDLDIPGSRLVNVPFSIDINDVNLFVGKSFTGPDYQRAIIDHFDQLYAEGGAHGRVIALPLHPFVTGQPSRYRYLEAILEHIVGHDGVWCTTTDEIAGWHQRERHV